MNVQKAGCVLIDINNKKIGLVYRPKCKDFSFPKGHLEPGETLEECVIRETEEETGRRCRIISSKALPVLTYIDSLGDKTETHMYLAIDEGPSFKTFDPKDVEELVWKDIKNVQNTLSYQNLKDFWNEIKPIVNDVLEDENS